MEGSSQGTHIKDSMTRTREGGLNVGAGGGQGMGEQWGEDGDNCY